MDIIISLTAIAETCAFIFLSFLVWFPIIVVPWALDDPDKPDTNWIFNIIVALILEFFIVCLLYNPLNIHMHIIA